MGQGGGGGGREFEAAASDSSTENQHRNALKMTERVRAEARACTINYTPLWRTAAPLECFLCDITWSNRGIDSQPCLANAAERDTHGLETLWSW